MPEPTFGHPRSPEELDALRDAYELICREAQSAVDRARTGEPTKEGYAMAMLDLRRMAQGWIRDSKKCGLPRRPR